MGTSGDGQADAANLAKVDHVVVVMMENRSFDHMLGYLSLTGRRPEIEGLHPGLANEHQGRTYPVHHLAATALAIDPDHSSAAIDTQIASGDMGGFVASAAATLAACGADDGDPGCVMGYYDGADVPVYDHLAEEFAVCDRWFVMQQAADRTAQAGTGGPGTSQRGPDDGPLNDLQQRILAATHELRRRGHPPDAP